MNPRPELVEGRDRSSGGGPMALADRVSPAADIEREIRGIGLAAKAAAATLALADSASKTSALRAAAEAIRADEAAILAANQSDVAAAERAKLGGAMIDRLALDPKRVAAMAKGLDEIAAF